MRLDHYLTKQGFSRSLAQSLIKEGFVWVKQGNSWKQEFKKSQALNPNQAVRVESNPFDKFVSRGGVKLEKALSHIKLNVSGFRVLDIGVSKGGFVDCLLKRNASSVVGVDVGSLQTHPSIMNHEKTNIFENTDAKCLDKYDKLKEELTKPFDLIVSDVSFTPLTPVLFPNLKYLKNKAFALALVKPSFEGPLYDFDLLKQKMTTEFSKQGLTVIDYFESGLKGKSGDTEFFIYAKNFN